MKSLAPSPLASSEQTTFGRTTGESQRARFGGDRSATRRVSSRVESLPTGLRQRAEAVSGLTLGGVRVHRNASAPSLLGARALSRGADIFLAPRQESTLPHELGHVVQQGLGPVPPTRRIGGVDINDDPRLEREATRLGLEFLRGPNGPGVAHRLMTQQRRSKTSSLPMQRVPIQMFEGDFSEKSTPPGAISNAFGIPVTEIRLPSPRRKGDLPRPKGARARIKKTTIRQSERNKQGETSKVTAMARSEVFLLQGALLKKFFDGGHLIADELIGEAENSFQLWNLAPQTADFNEGAYRRIETAIRTVASGGGEVDVDVNLDYPDDEYSVSLKTLIARRVVNPAKDGLSSDKVVIRGREFRLDERVKIPRRIPNRWEITANIVSGKKSKSKEFPSLESEFNEGFEDSLVKSLKAAKAPDIASPFRFEVELGEAGKKQQQAATRRVLRASQWFPTDEPRPEDVFALLRKTFPDLDLDGLQEVLGSSPLRKTIFGLVKTTTTQALQSLEISVKLASKINPGDAVDNLTALQQTSDSIGQLLDEAIGQGDTKLALTKIAAATSQLEILKDNVKLFLEDAENDPDQSPFRGRNAFTISLPQDSPISQPQDLPRNPGVLRTPSAQRTLSFEGDDDPQASTPSASLDGSSGSPPQAPVTSTASVRRKNPARVVRLRKEAEREREEERTKTKRSRGRDRKKKQR